MLRKINLFVNEKGSYHEDSFYLKIA